MRRNGICSIILIEGALALAQVGYAQDNSFNHNVISPLPTDIAVRQQLPLIGFDVNNDWKYHVGDTSANNLTGTGWEQSGFDDSTWGSGPSGLGLDASAGTGTGPGLPQLPIRTALPYATNSDPASPDFRLDVTTYFRKHFTFPAGTNGATLTLRDVVEDGAVYYLNGQEIFRNRMPAGAVTFATLATGAADPTPIAGPFSLSLTSLLAGDNVLAVEVHQSSVNSSDLELAVELTAEVTTILSGPPVVTGQPQNQTVNEGQSASLIALVQGQVPLAYTWHKGAGIVPGANGATLSFNPAVPSDSGTYYVSVTNALGGTNSLTATVTVVPDTTPPIIVSAIAPTNLASVVVTLNDPVPGMGIKYSTASNAANYQVHLHSGGGAIAVTSATAVAAGTNTATVTLTLAGPLTAGQNYDLVVSGVTDNAATPNAVTPSTHAIAQTVVLLGYNSTWRYDQNGLNLGTTWKDVGFNDGAWSSGPGVLGLETSVGTLTLFTNLAGGNGTNTAGGGIATPSNFITITFYFRANANLAFDPNAVGNSVLAHAYIDDGAILYVNGTEQLRYNQTNGPGYTNLANGALTETTQTFITTNLNGFAQGNNLIAVEIHQDSLGS